VRTLFIAKGIPWKNGHVESAGGKLRDELLNQELFLSMQEARWVVDRWRLDYTTTAVSTVHWITRAPSLLRPAVFFRLRLRLSLQTTDELLNPDSLTQLGTNFGGWSPDLFLIFAIFAPDSDGC